MLIFRFFLGILNTCTRLWLTELKQATPVDPIKDLIRSSVKVPEFDKYLKKIGGHISRNVVEITIEMKAIVRKPLMIKIIKLRLWNLDNLLIFVFTFLKLKLILFYNWVVYYYARQWMTSLLLQIVEMRCLSGFLPLLGFILLPIIPLSRFSWLFSQLIFFNVYV